jgi:hypothetical protein
MMMYWRKLKQDAFGSGLAMPVLVGRSGLPRVLDGGTESSVAGSFDAEGEEGGYSVVLRIYSVGGISIV